MYSPVHTNDKFVYIVTYDIAPRNYILVINVLPPPPP